MSLAIVHSRAQVGVEAPAVTVEVHLANGLPSLTMVGLPEAAVKESKDRVRSAIINSGLNFPARRITLNLAPADLPKDGGRYDLPMQLRNSSCKCKVTSRILSLNSYSTASNCSPRLRVRTSCTNAPRCSSMVRRCRKVVSRLFSPV